MSGKNEIPIVNIDHSIHISAPGSSADVSAPETPANAPSPTLQLTDVQCSGYDELDRLPGASLFAQNLHSSYLFVQSCHRGMVLMASKALCQSLSQNGRLDSATKEIRCKAAVLEDTDSRPLQDAVKREKPDVLVLHLAHERLLEKAISLGSHIQISGVKVIIATPESTQGNSHRPAHSTWSLNSPEELLLACKADPKLRAELLESQAKKLWPADEHFLAEVLANHIMVGGSDEVRKNIPHSQEQSSVEALKLLDEAAKRQNDGVVDRALLFLVSYFPEIPVAEIDSLLGLLLSGDEISVPNKNAVQPTPQTNEPAGPPPPAFIPVAAIAYWREHRRSILERNGLRSRRGQDGTTILDFRHASWGMRIKEAMDSWDAQDLMKKLHDSHLLLYPGISTAATNGLISATAELFVSAPNDYDADWLLRQVASVSELKDVYQERGKIGAIQDSNDPYSLLLALAKTEIRGQQLSTFLFERLANLCWNIMSHRTDTVTQFIRNLSSETEFGPRGALALQIVLRLRSQQRAGSTTFDAWNWLRHLLATSGSTETRSEVITQLVNDANSSAISTWQTLTKIMEWLRPTEDWKCNDAIQTWGFSFMYEGFQKDIDRHFFIDDQEGIPPWAERKSYLFRWLTHPGFALAMDAHLANNSARPVWLRSVPKDLKYVLNGEICIAEILDYWYFHTPGTSGSKGERVKELVEAINNHAAALPRRTEDPPRPVRRAIWQGLRTFNSIWAHYAMHLPTEESREKFKQRRDSAYNLAAVFR